jgi:hypothetical protein
MRISAGAAQLELELAAAHVAVDEASTRFVSGASAGAGLRMRLSLIPERLDLRS